MNASINPQTMILAEELDADIQSALERMQQESWISRMLDHDATLWDSTDPDGIAGSLGWLELPERIRPEVSALADFAEQVRGDFDRVVLLGMGGSSLAPWCFSAVTGAREGYPDLHVIDSTVPDEVVAAGADVPLARCLFIVASKSGTTAETRALFDYFWAQMSDVRGDDAGENFIVITDPGTPLVEAGRERGVRRIFENWPDIGGRYSALSYYGMVPAALIGMPIEEVLEIAAEMVEACASEANASENPGASLGAFLGICHERGRDKVTVLTSRRLATLGDWIEQLVAESTGKQGKGLVPVVHEPPLEADIYGDDRAFVCIDHGDDRTHDSMVDGLTAAGHPVVRIDVEDITTIGAEMYRWEFATAVAGAFMGINPFDQPNVQEAKDKTREVLQHYEETGSLPEEKPDVVEGSLLSGNVRGALKGLIDKLQRRDYLAIMAYLPRSEAVDDAIAHIRAEVAAAKGVATTFGYGPRFLHSTGQLHKGGPNSGVFLQLTAMGGITVEVPGADYDFATFKDAQAAGDLAALKDRDRRVMRVDLDDDIATNLGRLTQMIIESV